MKTKRYRADDVSAPAPNLLFSRLDGSAFTILDPAVLANTIVSLKSLGERVGYFGNNMKCAKCGKCLIKVERGDTIGRVSCKGCHSEDKFEVAGAEALAATKKAKR